MLGKLPLGHGALGSTGQFWPRAYPTTGAHWSEAWAEAQAAVAADVIELMTLELLHPAFVDAYGATVSVRAVCDTQDRNLPLEDSAPLNAGATVPFTGIPFDMPWPEVEEGRVPQLTIRIDNIGREIVPYLDAAIALQAPITVIMRVYVLDMATNIARAGIDPVTFLLRNVTVSETYVEGSASPADLANLRALRVIYDLESYPGLDYVNG